MRHAGHSFRRTWALHCMGRCLCCVGNRKQGALLTLLVWSPLPAARMSREDEAMPSNTMAFFKKTKRVPRCAGCVICKMSKFGDYDSLEVVSAGLCCFAC